MILDCDIKSLLIFVVLQGEFQDKLNKLESESVNEGRSSHLGQFLNFQFTTELAPQCNVGVDYGDGDVDKDANADGEDVNLL